MSGKKHTQNIPCSDRRKGSHITTTCRTGGREKGAGGVAQQLQQHLKRLQTLPAGDPKTGSESNLAQPCASIEPAAKRVVDPRKLRPDRPDASP